MALSSSKLGESIFGNKRVTWGTYTDDGSAGGDINTGLSRCDFIVLQPSGNAVETNAPSVNETFAANGFDGSAVTVVVDASSTGAWFAFGSH